VIDLQRDRLRSNPAPEELAVSLEDTRKEAGLPGFRFHDLRHGAVTQLAESAASDSSIMAIA